MVFLEGLVKLISIKKYKFKNFFLNIFLFLVVVRSTLDIFTNVGVYVGPIYFNIPSILSILVGGIGISYILFRGKININGLGKIFALWILSLLPFVFISIYNFGYASEYAVKEYIRLLTLFLVFLLSYNFTSEDNIEKILNCLFISLIIPSILAIYQLITKTGLIDHGVHRVYGTLAHPNTFAYFINLFIGLTYWKLKSEKFKIWFILLLLLEILLLITTFSFGGYIFFFIITLFMLFNLYKKQKGVIIFLMALFLIVLISTPQFQMRWDRIKMINIGRTITNKEIVDSFTWRIVNWSNLLILWQNKPLTGYGLHTTSIINPWKTNEKIGYAPHSDYIRYLVETGLLGFISYIVFIIYFGVIIYKKYKSCRDYDIKFLLYIIFSIFVAWQVNALIDNLITSTTFQFYFWVVCGSVMKNYKVQNI